MAEPLVLTRLSEPPPDDGKGSLVGEALQRGTRLGRYELLVPIAVGGMARVWAARLHGQRGFTKLVAIKTILPHLASDPEFERMLVDEAHIASGVRHPNVCEIQELGEERGVLYVAMEWVDGDSLSHVLKSSRDGTTAVRPNPAREPIDPRIAARIIADAAAGLHAAHNLVDDSGAPLHVVHRDVSPQNLLISVDGNVKVTDFGVAKALNTSHQATAAGQLKGKIAYMAPEQATGASIDRRSDVFSLGVILYEVTAGQQPFRGEGEHAVMQELLKGSFTPPSRVLRGYPFELERILTRAMAQQPMHRYATMDQMRQALEEWLAKSGPVVTQSHVAAVVRERIGAEIEQRKERIRAAGAAIADRTERELHVDPAHMTPSGVVASGPHANASLPSSHPTHPTHPTSLPPVLPLASRAPTGVQYVMAAALGVIAAAALGATGFWVWHTMSAVPAQHVATEVLAGPAAAPSVIAPTAAPIPMPAPAPVVAARPPITFKIVPDEARIVVDGQPLALGVRAVARPSAGKSAQVVVHADGFDDETMTIDDSVPGSVDVWLSPVKKPGSSAPPSGGAGAKAPEPLLPNPY